MQRKTKAQLAYAGFLAVIFGSCAYMASGGHAETQRLHEILAPVPEDLRQAVRQTAYRGQCAMLRDDLRAPCDKARAVMTGSAFLLEH